MTPHDALIEARLDEFHLIAHDARHMDDPVAGQVPVGAGAVAAARSTTRRTAEPFRVRFGRGLVALGAAIAGDDDRDRARRLA